MSGRSRSRCVAVGRLTLLALLAVAVTIVPKSNFQTGPEHPTIQALLLSE